MNNTNLPKSKGGRRLRRFLLLMLCGGLLYFAAVIGAIHIAGAADTAQAADAIIVLGAGLRRDGQPGWALTRRASKAADLWHEGIAPYVLCTGAQAEGYPRSEAAACRDILIGAGLPATAVLMEESSRSTEENAIYSRRLLERLGLSRVALVSDSYHMLRAGWLFRRQDLKVFTSPVPASRIRYPLFYPYSLVRELAALHWQLLKEALHIPVTHLAGL